MSFNGKQIHNLISLNVMLLKINIIPSSNCSIYMIGKSHFHTYIRVNITKGYFIQVSNVYNITECPAGLHLPKLLLGYKQQSANSSTSKALYLHLHIINKTKNKAESSTPKTSQAKILDLARILYLKMFSQVG